VPGLLRESSAELAARSDGQPREVPERSVGRDDADQLAIAELQHPQFREFAAVARALDAAERELGP